MKSHLTEMQQVANKWRYYGVSVRLIIDLRFSSRNSGVEENRSSYKFCDREREFFRFCSDEVLERIVFKRLQAFDLLPPLPNEKGTCVRSEATFYFQNLEAFMSLDASSIFDVYPEFPLKQEESGEVLNFYKESDILLPFGLSATELFKQFEKAMSIDDSATILSAIRHDLIDRNSLRDLTRDYLKTVTLTVTGIKLTTITKTKLTLFGSLDLCSYPGNKNDLGQREGTKGERSCDLEGPIQGEKPDRVQGSDHRVESATNPGIVNIDCLDSRNDQTDDSGGTSKSPVNLVDPLSENTLNQDISPVREEGAPTPVRSLTDALDFLERYVSDSDAMDDEAIFCTTRTPRMLQAQEALDAFLNDSGADRTAWRLLDAA